MNYKAAFITAMVMISNGLLAEGTWEIDGDPSDFPKKNASSFKPVDPPSAAGKFKEMLIKKEGDKVIGAIYIDPSYKGFKPEIRWDISIHIKDVYSRRISAEFRENYRDRDEIDAKAEYWNGIPKTRTKELDITEFNCICEKEGCEFEIPVSQLSPGQLSITVRKRAVNQPHESRIHGYLEDWDSALLKEGNSPEKFDGLPYDFKTSRRKGAVIKKGDSESLAGKWEKLALRIEDGYLLGAAFHDTDHYRSSHFEDVFILIKDSKGNALKYKFGNTLIDYAKMQAAPSKRWQPYTEEGAANICTRHGCEFKFPLKDLKKGPISIEYIRRGYITRTSKKHESKISGEIKY